MFLKSSKGRILILWILVMLALMGFQGVTVWFSDSSADRLAVVYQEKSDTNQLLKHYIDEEIERRLANGTSVQPGQSVINREGWSTGPRRPRLLCWIMADPGLLRTKVIHQRETWGKRCDKLLVISSSQDDTFPAIGVNVTEGRNHIAMKSRAAWIYIHDHHIDQYDFFIKTDPDTYLVVENLREYIQDKDPEQPYYYGHRFRLGNKPFIYMAGGPGLLLTRESVRRLVTKAFVQNKTCITDGQGEDWKICRCLSAVGCSAVDTRDDQGKERFLVFALSLHIHGNYPQWYRNMDISGSLEGSQCCSDYPVSFHYVNSKMMYELEYFFYHSHVHGRGNTDPPWPIVFKVSIFSSTKDNKKQKSSNDTIENKTIQKEPLKTDIS